MTTEYKLNTYIEWTDEDRAKGKCPVPKGSDVTLWFSYIDPYRTVDIAPYDYDWGTCNEYITAYLIHSVPREPIVRWVVIGGSHHGYHYDTEEYAKRAVANNGGRVVKMVEEME